jgi:hypothetical protein
LELKIIENHENILVFCFFLHFCDKSSFVMIFGNSFLYIFIFLKIIHLTIPSKNSNIFSQKIFIKTVLSKKFPKFFIFQHEMYVFSNSPFFRFLNFFHEYKLKISWKSNNNKKSMFHV